MNSNQPKTDDAVLGGQSVPPAGSAILGGVQGAINRLKAAKDQTTYLAACRELQKYENGDVLLRQLAIRRCIGIVKYYLYRVSYYQLVKHPKYYNSLYWYPELDSPFVPKRFRGKEIGEFLEFEDAKLKAKEIAFLEGLPLLWGIAPWVRADYSWLPPEEKPVQWTNLFEGNPLSEDGKVIRRAGQTRLAKMGIVPQTDPDHLVVNRRYPMSNHPMRLWIL